MKSPKYVYLFEEADGRNKKLFGGKGAGLAEMTRMGLPVPPGFIVTTEACRQYYENKKRLPKGLMEEVQENIKKIEEKTGKIFGNPQNPLFFSVRSGAAVSMPGMMDTILNLGLNDDTVEGLIRVTSDGRFAFDAYRRFIQLFGKIALGVEEKEFDEILERTKQKVGAIYDTDLDADPLKDICHQYLMLIKKRTGNPFPEDPMVQLKLAIEAVFKSWMGRRAVDYRREFNITPEMANGTAVNVCTMVFGNMGSRDGQRNGRQCVHDGVWKYGFRFSHRRGLYPGSSHRRKCALWGVSRQCSGGRCGGWNSHTQTHSRDEKGDAEDLS